MKAEFDPVAGKTAIIIETIMSSPDIPSDPGLEFKIRLCVEEVVENIVSYAYENGAGFVEVGTEIRDNSLIISFRDSGVQFNPLQKEDPDITLSAEERQVGGLGIFLCKQMMDDLRYVYENGCNNLFMTKRLS